MLSLQGPRVYSVHLRLYKGDGVKANTCIFLDVDGVLNQYNREERMRRVRTKGFSGAFNPFPKKVQRLHKIIIEFNIDVYLFSAWTTEKLSEFVRFNITEDTRKDVERINEISKQYKKAILIEDELLHFEDKLDVGILTLQPNYDYGLVLSDFHKLKRLLEDI